MYTKQPVRELPCRPRDQLELECAVSYSIEVDTVFTLRWTLVYANGQRNTTNSSITDKSAEKTISLNVASNRIDELSEIFCTVEIAEMGMVVSSNILNLRNVASLKTCNSEDDALYLDGMARCILNTPTTPPMELSEYVLYSVAAVVILFAILIVILSLSVALLCRRKCGNKPAQGRTTRMDCGTQDSDSTHSGFSNR